MNRVIKTGYGSHYFLGYRFIRSLNQLVLRDIKSSKPIGISSKPIEISVDFKLWFLCKLVWNLFVTCSGSEPNHHAERFPGNLIR